MKCLLLIFVIIFIMMLIMLAEAANDKNKEKERCFHHHRRKKWCVFCHDNDDPELAPAPAPSPPAPPKDDDAKPGKYPFVVGLISVDGRLKCTGAIITFLSILTSATCLTSFRVTIRPVFFYAGNVVIPSLSRYTLGPITIAIAGDMNLSGDYKEFGVGAHGPDADTDTDISQDNSTTIPPGQRKRKRRNFTFEKIAYTNPDGQLRYVVKTTTYTGVMNIQEVDPAYDVGIAQVKTPFVETTTVTTILLPTKLYGEKKKCHLLGFGCNPEDAAPYGRLRYTVFTGFKYETATKMIVFKTKSRFVGDVGSVMCNYYSSYNRKKIFLYGIGSHHPRGTYKAMYANVYNCKEWILKEQTTQARSLGILIIIISYIRIVTLSLIPVLTWCQYLSRKSLVI